MTSFTTPRRTPSVLVPVIAGSGVIALALPVYLVAGWRLGGWLLAATLWLGSQAFAYFLVRLRARGNLVAAGVAAFGMMFRAIAVMIVVFAVAVSDPWLGLAAAITYALAYTVELGLSLVTYFGSPPV
ncbi:MAG: hypothetical protein E6G45_01935 [Actinobacteria bacterium]|nr:MAG: hypothetical protein E6G45_01935 [Actinomycetota bacterium]